MQRRVPEKLEKWILTWICPKGEWGDLASISHQNFTRHLKTVQQHGMTMDQLQSLRHTLMIDLTKKRCKNLYQPSVKHKIVHYYEKEWWTMEQVSKALNLPPLICFRVVLERRNITPTKIARLLRDDLDDTCLGNTFSSSDLEQLKIAKTKDSVSNINCTSIRQSLGTNIEQCVQIFLENHKIPFITERKLKPNTGKPTPDFLISKPFVLSIDGHVTHWIEVKSGFCSVFTTTILNRTRQQLERYVRCYGSGVVYFAQGCSEKLTFGPCVLVV